MRTLALLALVMVGCGSSDGGGDMMSTVHDLSAATGDMMCSPAGGPQSRCGHPCDVGNSLGVGQYCKSGNDCAGFSLAKICSALVNGASPSPDDTYFCTASCDPGKPDSQCGENAKCSCQGGVGCGCTPNRCVQATG